MTYETCLTYCEWSINILIKEVGYVIVKKFYWNFLRLSIVKLISDCCILCWQTNYSSTSSFFIHLIQVRRLEPEKASWQTVELKQWKHLFIKCQLSILLLVVMNLRKSWMKNRTCSNSSRNLGINSSISLTSNFLCLHLTNLTLKWLHECIREETVDVKPLLEKNRVLFKIKIWLFVVNETTTNIIIEQFILCFI